MDLFENVLTHDFFLRQHPYRVLLAFERFVTLTHLQEWKQQQAVWDLKENGCLWVTYVYVREIRQSNFIRIAYLTDQFAYPKTYFLDQDVVPIFGNSDQVNLQIINRMRTFTIRSHGKPYTKSFGLKSIVFNSKLRQ